MIECSRALLLPGPQPPLSHFGATLLRHVVLTGLRFALDSLGAPMPEVAPVRIVRLRLYLDRSRLQETLASSPAVDALIGALLEPDGAGRIPPAAASTRGAASFHRARLRLRAARAPRAELEGGPPISADVMWQNVRSTTSTWMPALQDAILGELLASLQRRTLRTEGKRIDPCVGREAQALAAGAQVELSALGVPDPLVAAWSDTPRAADEARSRLGALGASVSDPRRGAFRELYRRFLNAVRIRYLPFAEAARDRGLLESTGDGFFIPFDLAEELAGDREPGWLARAVPVNRAEYLSLVDGGSPPETIASADPGQLVEDRNDWLLAPLWPLS